MAKLLAVAGPKRPRNRVYVRIPPETRFMAKVSKGEGSCWDWTATKDPKGYGRFHRIIGTPEPAHRSSFRMFRGPIPDGMFVCHTCDNPGCVNPDHLFLGTPADNTADMAAKWRTRTRLTPEQVAEIRASTGNMRDIAARFGLKSHKSVYNIRHGLTFSPSTSR